jgi:hypothetical protein
VVPYLGAVVVVGAVGTFLLDLIFDPEVKEVSNARALGVVGEPACARDISSLSMLRASFWVLA